MTWKIGDECEVWIAKRCKWLRGVVYDRAVTDHAAFAGQYRVVDALGERMRWSEWVSPQHMRPVVDANALAAERDAAIAERDRLRRELEALREACRIPAKYGATRKYIVDRLDAILRGGES